jgi:glutaminyl-peptide cyclotransferase
MSASPDFDGDAAWQHLLDQVALGVRAPGSPGHAAVAELFEQRLAALGSSVRPPVRQSWPIELRGAPVTLTNVLTRIQGVDRAAPTTLVGSHYDARWIADHDPDPERRDAPIPAANDGGSGTSVMLELARALSVRPPLGDVVLAFFDGEDLGDVDGFPYAVGSRRFVERPPEGFAVDRIIALDMVGGRDVRLSIEGNSLIDPRGRAMFVQLFGLGLAAGRPAFSGDRLHWIYSDHGPFLDVGLPAVCLIDIDYPQWHTHGDLPEACEAASLGQVGATLLDFLRGARIGVRESAR